MISNYFKTAFRNFWGNKAFSIINIFGLSIGISASVVIFLIVNYEFSFDRFEKEPERIYRVVLDAKFNGDEVHSAAVQAPLGKAMQEEITGLNLIIPIMQFQGDGTVKVAVKRNSDQPDVYKSQENIVFTNQQYFKLVPHQWIAGAEQSALNEPFKVVLSESKSEIYFPGVTAADVIGRQIIYNDVLVTVSGIVKDLNEHTTFLADEFISFPTISKTGLQDQFMMNVWNDWMAYSQLYVKLSPGTTVARTEAQLKTLFGKYNKDANKDANNTMAFHLQPLNDIHFNTSYPAFGQRVAHKPTLYGLMAIGGFLLLLGSINFINLTTAQASKRSKEIGIRKTMGSSRKNLVFQFLSETFIITSVATVLSTLLTPLLLGMFAGFIPPGLQFDLFSQPSLILFLISLTLLVSFLSGIYPALILSGYKAVEVLKGQSRNDASQTRSAGIRKSLTVSQFIIAQFFVIATLMVGKQISYSLNSDLGFNKDAIINFNTPRGQTAATQKVLLGKIKSLPGVSLASSGYLTPATSGGSMANISYFNGKEEVKPNVEIRWGDPDYLKVYEIKLMAGRNVAPSDTIKEFLVNEAYAHALGFKNVQDAIGKELQWNGKHMPIVGVLKDFHQRSFHAAIMPLAFGGATDSFFHVKLRQDDASGNLWRNTLTEIQNDYKKLYPGQDFEYHFYDATIAGFYENEQNAASLLRWATALSILISCLGLLGLVIYTTNMRKKEIGIRKVLGASVANLVSILTGDFIRLVFLASLIAVPLAWWATYQWLQDFTYRTTMSWWVFVLSGIAMMAVAMVTLSVQVVRSAAANPIKSLRND